MDYVGKTDPNLILDDECFPVVIEDVNIGNLKKSISHDEKKQDVLDLSAELLKCTLSTPETILEDSNLPRIVEHEAENLTPELVLLQAEDYGGGIALPHYGYRRPSVDYFNSNLMSYNFVIADISSGENNVFFYDERDKAKELTLCVP